MKIEAGMYFRAYGKIDKVRNIVRRSSLYEDSGIYGERYGKFIIGSKVIDEVPHSNNIIDLIEVGDYVNGIKITLINEPSLANCNKRIVYAEDKKGYLIEMFSNSDIKSILTHEQFESMKYEVK